MAVWTVLTTTSDRQPRLQQLNQQLIYHEAPNAQVVQQAATEVLRSQAQEHQTRAEASRVVAATQVQAAQEVASVHAQASSAVAGAQVQAVQQLAQLRAEFGNRERELLQQIQTLQSQVHAPNGNMSPNGTDLGTRLQSMEAKIDYLYTQFLRLEGDMRSGLDQLASKISQLEEWYVDDGQPDVNDEEELVAAPTSPVHVGSQGSRLPGQSVVQNPFDLNVGGTGFTPPPRGGHGDHGNPFGLPRGRMGATPEPSNVEEEGNLEDTCLHWKEETSVKFPLLPESAGSLRQWKNVVLPMLTALDRSPEAHLHAWLRKAFNALDPTDIHALKVDSEGEGFPKFDRMLCSWFTGRGDSLKGYFGPRIQAYIEETMNLGTGLRGRPLLNMVVREFDLDNALGGVISGVELFQIASPEGDYQSLVHFRDRVQYVWSQLPIQERPSENMLSRWLFGRLKKIRSLSIVIDRIKETPAGSHERTFQYLWSRLNRYISECQHDKNLSTIQGDLRKGPPTKKPAATAKATPNKG